MICESFLRAQHKKPNGMAHDMSEDNLNSIHHQKNCVTFPQKIYTFWDWFSVGFLPVIDSQPLDLKHSTYIGRTDVTEIIFFCSHQWFTSDMTSGVFWLNGNKSEYNSVYESMVSLPFPNRFCAENSLKFVFFSQKTIV